MPVAGSGARLLVDRRAGASFTDRSAAVSCVWRLPSTGRCSPGGTVGARASTEGPVSRSAAAVMLRQGRVLAAVGALWRAPALNCLVANDSADGSAAAAAEVRCAYCLRSVGSAALLAGPC